MFNFLKVNKNKFIEKNFIDDRNNRIWNELKQKYNFEIDKSNNHEYSCFIQAKKVIIYYDDSNICKDSFTHELLHVYLNSKEFYLGNNLNLIINNDANLSRILSKQLIEHISNCLDHIKMFSIFNELGFDKFKFIVDYFDRKCDRADVLELTFNYRYYTSIDSKAADFFIGKLVGMLCDVNEEHNYTEELNDFRQIDKELYDSVCALINNTKDFDINDMSVFNQYRSISSTFYENLKKWQSNNRFTNYFIS